MASGRLTDAQAEQARQILASQAQQIQGLALERIIDNRIQANLATQEGVSVTDADIDAKLVEEATTPAARHLWAIEVEPAVSDGALEPTTAQIAEARTKANDARADVEGGAKWEDVAKSVSTDVATRDQGGDLGWVLAEDRSLDEGLLKAAFEVEPNGMTDVIEGEDGVFRIGRVTEAQDDQVDELYQTKMQNEGVDLAKYREVVRGDVIRTKLEDKIVADVSKPGPQRRGLRDLHPVRRCRGPGVGRQGPPHPVLAEQHRARQRGLTAALRRSGLGEGEGRRRRGVREAQGEPRAVRRDGADRERRDRRPGDDG